MNHSKRKSEENTSFSRILLTNQNVKNAEQQPIKISEKIKDENYFTNKIKNYFDYSRNRKSD